MDPYLESGLWTGFHTKLIAAIDSELNRLLPDRFVADCEVRQELTVVDRSSPGETFGESASRTIRPDVYVADRGERFDASTPVALIDDAIEIEWEAEPVDVPYVVLIDCENQRVVTEIELLSPSNKAAGPNRDAFLQKKQTLLMSDVSFVEIDLLIRGARAVDPPERAAEVYRVSKERPYVVSVYPAWIRSPRVRSLCDLRRLDERLPTVAVPLVEDTPPVPLDLQSALTNVYDASRYDKKINYAASPPVTLPPSLATQAAPFAAVS